MRRIVTTCAVLVCFVAAGLMSTLPALADTQTPVATPAKSPSPASAVPTSPVVVRVDVGGDGYRDAVSGLVWEADRPYAPATSAGGGWGYLGPRSMQVIAVSRPIGKTSASTVYQTQRQGLSGYRFDLPNGRYRVTLRLAELYVGLGAGVNVFDVFCQGERVLAGVDVYKSAGRYTAYDRTFSAVVSAGVLNLTVRAGSGTVAIAALDVESESATLPASTGTPVLPVATATRFLTVTQTLTATQPVTGSQILTPTMAATPAPSATKLAQPTAVASAVITPAAPPPATSTATSTSTSTATSVATATASSTTTPSFTPTPLPSATATSTALPPSATATLTAPSTATPVAAPPATMAPATATVAPSLTATTAATSAALPTVAPSHTVTPAATRTGGLVLTPTPAAAPTPGRTTTPVQGLGELTRDGFTVIYREGEQQAAADVLDAMAAISGRISQDLGLSVGAVEVRLFSTREEYNQMLGATAPADQVGNIVDRQHVFLLAPNKRAAVEYEDILKGLQVEMVRLALMDIANVPAWLRDGVASFEAGLWNEARQQYMRGLLGIRRVASLRGLDGPSYNYLGGAVTAHTVVEYLTRTYGPEVLPKMLEAMKTQTFEQALRTAAGVSFSEFDRGWLAYVTKTYSGQ